MTDPTPATWPPPPPGWLPAPGQPVSSVPATVQAAAIVTWVCCGLTVLLTVFFLLAAAFIGSLMLDGFGTSGVVDIALVVAGTAAAVVVTCGVASWFAWSLWRRRAWARIALSVCSGLALVLSVVTLGPHSVLMVPGSIAVLVLLFLPQTSDWLRAG